MRLKSAKPLLAILVMVFALLLSLDNRARADQSQQAYQLAQQAVGLLKANRNQEAATLLWRASKLDPANASISYNLAVAFANLKRPKESWQAVSHAVQLDPNNWHGWLLLGAMYAECGDKANAIKTFTDARKRFAGNAEAQTALTDGLSQVQTGVSQIQELRSGLTGNAQDARRWHVLAQAYSKQGKHPEAIQTLNAAVKRFPSDSSLHWALASSYSEIDKHQEALKEYRIASQLDPTNPKLVRNIMYCQTKIGDLDGLQETRKLFLAKFPADADAKGMQEEISYYDTDFKATRQRETIKSASEMSAPFASVGMPLKVYVHNRLAGRTVWSSKPQATKDKINYSVLLERAFTEWSNASAKKITFIFVDDPGLSNVECEWTEDKNKLHYGFADGVTSYGTNSAGQCKARIFLLIDDAKPDENRFYTTSLHEIGHALGLSHSSSPKDIMYFAGADEHSAPSLSSNDMARLRQMYNVI